jgi:hypothetical protein
MSIGGAYRRMPDYLALFLSLLGSSFVALTTAFLGAAMLDFLLGGFMGRAVWMMPFSPSSL